jgi:hypothetical protein
MKAEMKDLKTRTKEYALRIIRLYSALPQSVEAHVIGKQLLRSGTSVGAHYREGMRARSDAEFISKIEGGLQKLSKLMSDAGELTAILITCAKNARNKNGNSK